MVAPVTAEQLEEKIYEILTTEDASNLSKKKVRALLSQCFGAALEVKKRKQEIKEITMKVVRKIQSDHAQGAVEPPAKTKPVEQPKKPPSPKPVPPPPASKPVEVKKPTPTSYTDLEVSTRTKKLLKSLTTAQLQQLSIKAVRKMLEEQLGVSLKPQKKVVKLSVEMFTEDLQRKMKQEKKKAKRKREEVEPATEPEGKLVKRAKVLPTEQKTEPKSTKKRKHSTGSESIQSTKENEPIRLKKRKLKKRQEQEDDLGKKKSKEINVKTEIKSQQLTEKQSIPDIKTKVVAKKPAHRESVNQKSKSSTDKPKKIRPSGLQRAKKKLPKTIEPAKPIEPNVKKEEQKDKKEEQKDKKEEQKDEKKEKCETKQTSKEKNKVKSNISELNETKEVIAEKERPKESDKSELQKKTEVTIEQDQPQKQDKNIRPERKDDMPEVEQPKESDKEKLQEASAETLEKAQLEIPDKDKVTEEKEGKPQKEKSQEAGEEKLQRKTEEIPEKEPSQVEKTVVADQTSTNENSEQAGDKIQTKVLGEKAEEEKITTIDVNAATDKEDEETREKAESKDNQSKQDTLPTTATIEVSPSIIEEKDAIDITSNKEPTQSVKPKDGDSKTEVPSEEVQESSPPPYLDEELTNVVSLDELLRTEDWTMKTVFESAKAELRKSSVEDVAEKAFKVVQSRFGEKSSTLPAALYPLLVKYKLDANWPIPPRMEPFIFSVYSSCSVDFLTYLRVHGVPEVAKDDENRTILHLVSYSLARASHNGENDDMWAVLELLKSGGFSFDESANELGSAMDILQKYGTADAVSRAKALVT